MSTPGPRAHGTNERLEFFDALVRYETHLWNHLDGQLRRTNGTTLATLTALRVVERLAGTCRVQDLRSELGITVGAASKMVDRLEREELVTRAPHPHDRRSSVIALTPIGHTTREVATEALRRGLGEHLTSDDTVAELGAALAVLTKQLTPPPAAAEG